MLPVSIKIKNIVLIIASLFFYAFGEPVYVLLMIGSSIWNYIFGYMLGPSSDGKAKYRKVILVIAVIVNIGILGVFKYTGFIIDNINKGLHAGISIKEIALPIGISFFTFQALSYVCDVYRDPKLSQKNYLNVLLYISMFPQLVAGPIVKYGDINEQINERQFDTVEISNGISRFCKGLFKKMFLANVCAVIADDIFALNINEYGAIVAWLGAIAYALQIYYDFSAYSDMAIGLGHMFGFSYKENFNHPYCATSIKDFWSRWHISLSTWFKEYVYIPLGGNREGKFKTERNKMTVFLLTGIWHGANWTFILWGIIHGVFNVLEDTILPIRKLKIKVIANLYTLLVAVTAFVFFRADTISKGLWFVKSMFTNFWIDTKTSSMFLEYMNLYNIVTLIVAIIFAYPVSQRFNELIKKKDINRKVYAYMAMVMLFLCMLRLSSGAYNPFIYFRF
ncbi:MBOAT family O-acyltransferase [Eubacterium uniforme]|nr:MBOAT family O-acyltransferase [Eubacterium uniforme]